MLPLICFSVLFVSFLFVDCLMREAVAVSNRIEMQLPLRSISKCSLSRERRQTARERERDIRIRAYRGFLLFCFNFGFELCAAAAVVVVFSFGSTKRCT